ncbi:carbohydrate ABC transporter substrate-binding protein [Chitinilyticum litopenaei]|uniref:Probable sugar-binding periplasmic protein n=2 Tax=Chitinilyticum piscinae TaxID=2866724 RepID=A0A8J7K8U4_9NEIS|nr:carbohydrate ABC transporter substrate-binding protein [Chitinilyticum piscinae]
MQKVCCALRPAAGLCSLLLTLVAAYSRATEVEVLHWWTAGGESRALGELRMVMEQRGHAWRDLSVAGGGGSNAMTALKSRVMAGHPPAAAQIKGPAIQEWGAEDSLASIDAVAVPGRWDAVLPPVVARMMKYRGQYVAAPLNVHRVNWLWVNPRLLRQAGVKPPASLDELFAALDALKKAGILPLAYGGQPWQDATVFESVALAVGGPEWYQKAFVELDQAALKGAVMQKALESYRRLKPYTDANAVGREWNLSTAMVINGRAAMQFMGDWAKGEFLAAGKRPGIDFLCMPVPGTAGMFTFNVDSFVFFRHTSHEVSRAQAELAAILMDPAFQERFSLQKGSIPVRSGARPDRYDACGRQALQDFQGAAQSGLLLPSWAQGMATSSTVQQAMQDVLTRYWNEPGMTAAQAAWRLAAAAKTR